MSKRRAGLICRTAMQAVAFGMAVSVAAPVLGGHYLPVAGDLPKAVNAIDPDTASNHVIGEYVGGLTVYQEDVYCPDDLTTKVGTLDFEYAAYKGWRSTDPAGTNTIGGAAIRGGFDLDPDFMLAPGCELRWLQVFFENGSADGTVDGSPLYPSFGIAGIEADLYDVPFDLLTTDINVSFESALVCVKSDTQEIKAYMGSFLWGYEISGGVVTAGSPAFWSSEVTMLFKDAVAEEYPGVTLTQGCCIIPEPGTVFLLAIGLVSAHWRRRAA